MSHEFATTFARFHQFLGPAETSHVTYVDPGYPTPGPSTVTQELRRVAKVVFGGRKHQKLLLNAEAGSIQPDVLAGMVFGFMPRSRRPTVAIMGDMWQPDAGLTGRIQRAMIRLADRGIDHYIVYSSEALDVFPRMFGIDPAKVRLALYFYSFSDQELALARPASEGEHVFAGGNTHRDYDPVIEAARAFPDETFVLATNLLDDRTDLPANIRAGAVDHAEFVDLMARSKVVLIPVRRDLDRSNSQQTYLNAMMMGKPVVISDVFGVRDHAINGESITIVDGSAGSYVDSIGWLLDPANADKRDELVANGRRDAARFSRPEHARSVMNLMAGL